MKSRQARTLAASGAVLATLLTAGVASAQYYAPPPPPGYGYVEADGPRFRGGISLNGGALIVPGVVNIGSIGVQGQLGVQINNQWGVYAIPSFDVIVGSLGGIGIGAGVLAEFTFPGLPISLAAGPEAGLFVAIGGSGCDSNVGTCSSAGGALYGGRLRFEYHPIIVRRGIRRRALTLGADLRFLTGAFGASSVNSSGDGTVSASSSFVISPALFIGYTAF
jgi:hypothetical protein